MPGHIDLGQHGNAQFSSIDDDVAYLVVGVKTTLITTGTLKPGIVQLRIGSALDAPGGMVGEMPVKEIELIGGEKFEVFFELFHRTEVAPCVVHEAAQRKGGIVFDPHAGRCSVFGSKLSQSGFGPKDSAAVFGPNGSPSVDRNGEHIALGG